MKKLFFLGFVVFALSGALLALIFFSYNTSAKDTDYGQLHRFYWGGQTGIYNGNDQLVPCSGGGSAFKESDAESNSAFIEKLRKYYDGCGQNPDDQKRNKIGAKTIVSILTDAGWGNEGSFSKLEEMFEDPRLSVSWEMYNNKNYDDRNMSHKINTYTGDKSDNFFGQFESGKTLSIIIRYNNEFIMSIRSTCGNIWGEAPKPIWAVPPDVEPEAREVSAGKPAIWKVTSKVTAGPTYFKSDLQYFKSGDWSGSGTGATTPSGSAIGTPRAYDISRPTTNADIGKTFCVKAISSSGYGNSSRTLGNLSTDNECIRVTGTPPPTPTTCRPITKTITAQTYSPISNGQSGSIRVYSNSYTPTYKASTDVYSDPTIYTGTNVWRTVDLTRLNTDGNLHNVTLRDTTNHVTSMAARFPTWYDRIERRTGKSTWIPTTYKKVTDTSNCIKKDKKGNCTQYGTKWVVDVPGHWSSISWSGWSTYSAVNSWNAPSVPGDVSGPPNYTQYRLISYAKYKYTDVYYSDGTVTQKVSGLVPSYTNSNGSTRTYSLFEPTNHPCFDYMLNTSINSFGNTMESGATISINPSVSSKPYTQGNLNSFWSTYRTHTKSKNTYWQVTKLVIQPGRPLPNSVGSSVNSANNPCQYYDPSNISTCTTHQSGSTVVSTGGSSSSNLSSSFTVPDVRAGTKICFGFSVRPDRSDPSNASFNPDSRYWQHSAFSAAANCILVVKKPKVQVWGGDIEAGKTLTGAAAGTSIVETSQSVKSGVMFGSWVEYGLLATGGISGMGSGSALSGGRPGANSCTIAQLTFANTRPGMKSCNGSYFGNYRYGVNMKNLTGYFTNPTNNLTSSTFALNPSMKDIYTSTLPNINITGGTVGRTVVLNAPNSNVTISGNINYTNGNVGSLTDIPQMVIIARNIYINANVSKIDSWLIAPEGKINTCIEGGERTPLTVFTCNSTLLINGPVMANQLYLRRTAGSNPASESGDPAEIINLRSDAYLWMYSLSKGDNRIRNTYVVELPPRL